LATVLRANLGGYVFCLQKGEMWRLPSLCSPRVLHAVFFVRPPRLATIPYINAPSFKINNNKCTWQKSAITNPETSHTHTALTSNHNPTARQVGRCKAQHNATAQGSTQYATTYNSTSRQRTPSGIQTTKTHKFRSFVRWSLRTM